MLTPLGLARSFGFGDRLGLATPGHLAAVRGSGFAPVFAQQSVRENTRTGRTPQQVLDDARRAVDAAGWDAPWGADADHLKTLADLSAFVTAGYTFYTVDPGEHVDNTADTAALPAVRARVTQAAGAGSGPDWEELRALYLDATGPVAPWGRFDEERLLRAAAKYGRAIRHTTQLYRELASLRDVFDFEVSVDETDAPTSALEHFFIANELTRAGVKFTSLAPRFIGSFEKGVDYVGDLAALDAELARHAAVTRHFGSYKLSLHSGSDKFSVYPLIARHWGERVHVKTAGTSYLEALRALAVCEPAFFRQVLELSLARYDADRASYHVSAETARVHVPADDGRLPALLEDFDAREVLHVAFGSVLGRHGPELKRLLVRHRAVYADHLHRHLARHLAPFNQPEAVVS